MAITDKLQEVLANTYLLYLKTQNYHWNVNGGPHFKSLHELFETHYEELADAVDTIAERIRQLGQLVPASFAEFAKSSKLQEGKPSESAKGMLEDLLADQTSIGAILKDAWKEADDSGDEVTADMLIQRMAAHEKAAWFYKSSIG